MVAFSKIKPGDLLFDVHSTKMGNTNRSTLGCWPVRVESVDEETRTAMCRWNVNAPRRYTERMLGRLRRTPLKKKA